MNNQKGKAVSKKFYISALSVLASFAVVVLHVNGVFWNFSRERYWITANIIESVMYFAVPVFFMITGATLMNYNKRYSTKEFFKKRFIRTVIPFIVWSVFAGIFIMLRDHKLFTVPEFLNGILNCKFVDFYWFFPALFAVYLAIPFLSVIPEEKRKKWFGYAIVVAIVVNSLLPFISKILKLSYSSNFVSPVITGYVIYALIGYWIDSYELSKKQRNIVYICGIIGLLAMIIGTYYCSYSAGKIDSTFKGYTNIPCIAYSVAIFVFFKYFKTNKTTGFISKLIKLFAPLAYGIYLVQWFVLQLVYRISWVDRRSLLYRTIGAVVIYLVCAGLVWVLSKVPIVRKIVV